MTDESIDKVGCGWGHTILFKKENGEVFMFGRFSLFIFVYIF